MSKSPDRPSPPSPAYLGHGAAGCVFYPAVRCGATGRTNVSSISKVFNARKHDDAATEFDDSKRVSELVDPDSKFTIKTREMCLLNTRKHIRQNEMKHCHNLEGKTVDAANTRPLLPQIVYEDGGLSLSEGQLYKTVKLEDMILAFRAMFEALPVLHTHRIIHMDVKPGNIVFNKKTRKLALIDFGLAYTKWGTLYRKEGINDRMFQFKCRYQYLPPELNLIASVALKTKKYSNQNFEALISRTQGVTSHLDEKDELRRILRQFVARLKEEYRRYEIEIVEDTMENVEQSGAARALGTLLTNLAPYIDKIDVYGLGITLFEMILSYVTYKKSAITESRIQLVEDLLNVIEQMVHPNPRYRATPIQALAAYMNAFPDFSTKTIRVEPKRSPSVSPSSPSPARKLKSPAAASGGGSGKKTHIYKFYADWCGYCVAMRPAWHATKAAVAKDNRITITEIESDDLPDFEKKHGALMRKIRASLADRLTFPTIVAISPSGKATQFTGARTPKTMIKFIRSFSSSS